MSSISFQYCKFTYNVNIKQTRYSQIKSTQSIFINCVNNCIYIDKNYFSQSTKVNDNIRFGINVKSKTTKKYLKTSNEPIIVLLLESPHTSEYIINNNILIPQRPANGMKLTETGGAIDKYLCKVIDQINRNNIIIPNKYRICICNPVQYQASLGSIIGKKLIKSIRDSIWRQLWNNCCIKIDFRNRINGYNPSYILNACTSNLKNDVNSELCLLGLSNITIQLKHPAINWSKGKYF